MGETADLTVQILREIRDAIHETNARIDQTRTDLSARIDQTNGRLDQANGRLDKVEEALLELATQQRFMVRQFTTFAEKDRGLESDVDDLRHRVQVLESRGASHN